MTISYELQLTLVRPCTVYPTYIIHINDNLSYMFVYTHIIYNILYTYIYKYIYIYIYIYI